MVKQGYRSTGTQNRSLTIDNRSWGFPVPTAPGFIKTMGRPTRSRLLSKECWIQHLNFANATLLDKMPTFAIAEKYPGSRPTYHSHHPSLRAVYLDLTIQVVERDVI